MKDLLEIIIKELVDNKDDVSVREEIANGTTKLFVRVNSNDMGRVIGKNGKMAKSIRTVMKSVANREHKKINIEFVN